LKLQSRFHPKYIFIHISYLLIELSYGYKSDRSIEYKMTYRRVQNDRLLSTKWPNNSEYKMTMVQKDQVPLYVEIGM